MATLIPESIPNATKSEKRVARILQKLPEDWLIYYEPLIYNRHPDFIIIAPDLGVIVIEVKGWYAGSGETRARIVSATPTTVTIREGDRKETVDHPIEQARQYMWSLHDFCRKSPYSKPLLQEAGRYEGKFRFPFSCMGILSNVTEQTLQRHANDNVRLAFPTNRVALKDDLDRWETLDCDQLRTLMKGFFDPFWEIEPMTEKQVNVLRYLIHPEVLFEGQPSEFEPSAHDPLPDLKVLDLKQEEHSLSLGSGHRIISGVAGSGKTLILIARAKHLSRRHPDWKILLLCYNKTLASFLQSALRGHVNVTVLHFHSLAYHSGVRFKKNDAEDSRESDADFGERLLKHLQEGRTSEARKYDAVLVDEAQDFEASWFRCVLQWIKDPDEGDLIVVCDGHQSLYRRSRIRWKDVGIHAVGRTIGSRFHLQKNYRNTAEILVLAEGFTTDPSEPETEDGIGALEVRSKNAIRAGGPHPVLIRAGSKAEEVVHVVDIIGGLLQGTWKGHPVEALRPADIGIVYRAGTKTNVPVIMSLISRLRDLPTQPEVTWLNDPSHDRHGQISAQSVKVGTIHSSKGLQYRAVFVLFADECPATYADTSPEAERRLFYVALTRAEEFLVISQSRNGPFTDEILKRLNLL